MDERILWRRRCTQLRRGDIGWAGCINIVAYCRGRSAPHLSAGIAYFLLALGNTTNNASYTVTALAGGRYLTAVANLTGGRCIIFHDSETPGLFYLTNCHGPPGTGRFFLRAAAVSGNATWAAFARGGANALQELAVLPQTPGSDNGTHASMEGFTSPSLPPQRYSWYVDYNGQPTPPWNNVGLCDGSAAAVEYFLTLFRLYGEVSDLAFARSVADDVLSRATVVVPGEQLSWVTTEWRTDPTRTTGPQVCT